MLDFFQSLHGSSILLDIIKFKEMFFFQIFQIFFLSSNNYFCFFLIDFYKHLYAINRYKDKKNNPNNFWIFFQRTWLIKLFEFGSTKGQRQINAANPDVRNKIKTISAFLLCQKHISLFPTTHSIIPSPSLNIFFVFAKT